MLIIWKLTTCVNICFVFALSILWSYFAIIVHKISGQQQDYPPGYFTPTNNHATTRTILNLNTLLYISIKYLFYLIQFIIYTVHWKRSRYMMEKSLLQKCVHVYMSPLQGLYHCTKQGWTLWMWDGHYFFSRTLTLKGDKTPP